MFWIWLLLILPWLVLVWMSLRLRSGATTWVNAAFLWPIERASAGGTLRRRPTAWAIVALVSLLLAILSLTDVSFFRSNPATTIIIDRTPSMTPEQIEQVSRIVRDVTDVRDEVTIDQSQLFVEVRKTLNQFGGPIVVVSDREMIRDPRVITMVPSQSVKNIGIAYASAVFEDDAFNESSGATSIVSESSAMLFLTILNNSRLGEVDVRITCGSFVSEQKIQLPTQSNSVLVSFEPRDTTVLVQLRPPIGSDEIATDDQAVLRAEALISSVVVSDDLRGDTDLMRLVESYRRGRLGVSVGGLPGEVVRIVRANGTAEPTQTDRMIFLNEEGDGTGEGGRVEWAGGDRVGLVGMTFPSDTVSSRVPGSDWDILARRDGEGVIGVGGKSVWIGVDSPTLRKSVTWAVLLAFAIDHSSGYPMRFVVSPQQQNNFARPGQLEMSVTTQDGLIERLERASSGTTHPWRTKPTSMASLLLITCVIGLLVAAVMCYYSRHAAE